MPIIHVEQDYTPATFNTPQFSDHVAGVLATHFGADRVCTVPSVMGGEDFGQYYRADNTIESLIFWVGGVDPEKVAQARRGEIKLPSLHSPHWAPDPVAVIGTAAKAMTVAALDILKKS